LHSRVSHCVVRIMIKWLVCQRLEFIEALIIRERSTLITRKQEVKRCACRKQPLATNHTQNSTKPAIVWFQHDKDIVECRSQSLQWQEKRQTFPSKNHAKLKDILQSNAFLIMDEICPLKATQLQAHLVQINSN